MTYRIIRHTGPPKSGRPLVHISLNHIQWSVWSPWQWSVWMPRALAEIRVGCCRPVQRRDGGHTSPSQVSRLGDPISGANLIFSLASCTCWCSPWPQSALQDIKCGTCLPQHRFRKLQTTWHLRHFDSQQAHDPMRQRQPFFPSQSPLMSREKAPEHKAVYRQNLN